MVVKFENLTISWLGHSGFLITSESGKKVIIDPFKVDAGTEVDIVISTHEHFDHCHPESISKFVGANTHIVGIPMAKDALEQFHKAEKHYVAPGDELEIAGVKISCIAAYNLNKFRAPGKPFHPKEDGKVGVIVDIDGTKVFHAGDSDCTDELKAVVTDVALLPVSGTYVMDFEEAIRAVNEMKPKLAIPMHFGSIVGDKKMAEKFKKGINCKCELPSK